MNYNEIEEVKDAIYTGVKGKKPIVLDVYMNSNKNSNKNLQIVNLGAGTEFHLKLQKHRMEMEENKMKEIMERFDKCLDSWLDLPDYVYSDEYRNAFIGFIKKNVDAGIVVNEGFIVMTLHHETDDRLPYFDFDRE